MIYYLFTNPIEYFCFDCKQLRLCNGIPKECNNCNSKNIKTSKPGDLNKEELIKQTENT